MPFRRHRITPRERQLAEWICRHPRDGHRPPRMEDVARALEMELATAKAHLRSLALKLPNPHGLPAQRLVFSFRDALLLADRVAPQAHDAPSPAATSDRGRTAAA